MNDYLMNPTRDLIENYIDGVEVSKRIKSEYQEEVYSTWYELNTVLVNLKLIHYIITPKKNLHSTELERFTYEKLRENINNKIQDLNIDITFYEKIYKALFAGIDVTPINKELREVFDSTSEVVKSYMSKFIPSYRKISILSIYDRHYDFNEKYGSMINDIIDEEFDEGRELGIKLLAENLLNDIADIRVSEENKLSGDVSNDKLKIMNIYGYRLKAIFNSWEAAINTDNSPAIIKREVYSQIKKFKEEHSEENCFIAFKSEYTMLEQGSTEVIKDKDGSVKIVAGDDKFREFLSNCIDTEPDYTYAYIKY